MTRLENRDLRGNQFLHLYKRDYVWNSEADNERVGIEPLFSLRICNLLKLIG